MEGGAAPHLPAAEIAPLAEVGEITIGEAEAKDQPGEGDQVVDLLFHLCQCRLHNFFQKLKGAAQEKAGRKEPGIKKKSSFHINSRVI